MRRRHVHLFDVLLGAFRGCLWTPYADLRFADARPDVVHPAVFLRLFSLLPPRCLSSDNLLYIDTGKLSKNAAKATRKCQNCMKVLTILRVMHGLWTLGHRIRLSKCGITMFDYQTISVEAKEGVHWLTLNRPESLNAINTQMATELRDYFSGLFQDRSCRVVVMKGAGRAYCAGLDIKDHAGLVEAPFGGGFGFQGHLADVYIKMRRCPQPIISLVHGAASGGGFAFALASDIRIAGDSMKMNSAFIKIGLSSCDMGVSYFLPRLVGVTIASEMMMTGRFVNAERALAVGLVNEVVSDEALDEAAQVFVDEMMATSPMGLRMTKEGLNMAIDAGSLEAAMAIENRNQVMCSSSADFKEGLQAFIEKRTPVYRDA